MGMTSNVRPARAGMSPKAFTNHMQRFSPPRASGDEP